MQPKMELASKGIGKNMELLLVLILRMSRLDGSRSVQKRLQRLSSKRTKSTFKSRNFSSLVTT
jgi:hypothetical protein